MLKTKKTNKILAVILLILTLFSIIQPVFAVSGSGNFVGGQFASGMKTTDNQNTSTGVLIRKLINNTTGQKMTVFCAEHLVDFRTNISYNGEYYTPTDSAIKRACKVAYFGWYSKYPDYVVDGGILATDMKWVKEDYVFTQQYIWEVLGQSNATFIDSDIQSRYVSFKNDINNKIDNMQKRPSFSNTTITLDVGTTNTLTDTNGVLKDYNSIDKTVDGIRIVHTKGENTMQLTINADCTSETYKITNEMMESWGMIKEETANRDTTVYFAFKEGVQNQLYSLHYNDPVTMALSLKINLFGKLEIVKKDNKGNYVQNTSFKISRNSDMSDPIGTYTTGNNGKVVIDKLKLGTIYIQETSVPKHLNLDTTIRSVTINPAQTTTYQATNNWKQGKIKIVKKDVESNKVVLKAGTIFDIYNTENKKTTSVTTNESGVAISGLLDYGTYYVKEQKAPNKYTVKVEVSENIGVVEDGKIYDITVLNTRVKGSVSISKEDTKTGKQAQGEATLEGAIYGLYARTPILDPADDSMIYNTDVKVAELVTNAEANAIIDNLYLGQYYIKEITPSKGYTLDTTKYEFDLTYENQNVNIITKNVTVKERVISQPFQIIKISSDEAGETELLEGAEFTIKAQKDIDKYGSWENAPIAKNANGETTKIMVTDNKGYAVSDRLPFGTYIVRETKVPDDKCKVEDFKVVITKDSSEPQVWRVFNDTSFTSILKIVKQDAETGKTVKVAGAKFKIKNLDTNKYFGYWDWSPLPHYVDSWTTDETGTVMTGDKLEVGNYQLEELESPNGYVISITPIKFKITSNTAYETLPDGKTPVITVKQKDTPVKGKVNVEKTGEVLVDFVDGKFIYEEKGLPNAKYEIFAKEDILDPSNDGTVLYKKGTVVDTIITNSDGKATSKELPLGEYSVKEIEAPYGFILNEEIKDVLLKYKDQNTAIVFDNVSFVNERQRVDIKVSKKDKDDDKELSGAEFSIYAKEDITNYNGDVIVKANELIETAISDETGKAFFKSDFPLTKFLLKETKAPRGYIASDEVIDIDAEYKGQDINVVNLEYEMKNEKMKGYIQIVKTSNEDNEYSKLPKGSPLENVVFEIYDSENKLVDTITTDETGKAISKELVIGKYKIKEISSADYYLLNEETYDVEIVDDGTIDVNITNNNVDIDIEVTKKGFIETQSKDSIYYDFSNIHNKSNIPLDNFTWSDSLPTNALRANRIYTGTWNEELTYSVWYKTNLSDEYIMLVDDLSTQINNEIKFTDAELKEGEFITDFEFRFGTVKADFKEVEEPRLYCDMLDNLPNGFVFVNHTKVSGNYKDVYVEDKDDWKTITYYKEIELSEKLPRTGNTDYSSFIATGVIMLINGIGLALTLREKKDKDIDKEE